MGAATQPPAPATANLDIPYEKHVLDNGLTLLIHEDHKAPLVAVNVWYHVGSKDERPGRTGFAHLFEHLMFNGSEHYNDEYFKPLESAGATKMNGTTWLDRTNYFQNVPTSALDRVLWMESDRMGFMVGAITQERLDEQRGVVQNEKRQGESQPYGKVDGLIAASTYPAGHPYSWETIGSMEDLNAASLDDVKEWFRTWYGAANAVLVIAGEVNPAEIKSKVEHYFGDIPAGPELRRQSEWIAKMTGTRRAAIEDRVPQARIYKTWNIPGYKTREFELLGLAAQLLAGSKNSRLYQRLVYKDQTATAVSADIGPFEIGSQFQVDVTVKPGGDAKAVERALDEELARFLRDGPTEKELERVKTVGFAAFARSLERLDGFGGKSATLAQNEVYAGSADHYKQQLAWDREATPADIRKVAQDWLSDSVFVLNVDPVPEYRVAESGADRSRLPDTGAPPPLKLPPLQRMKLANGLEVVLAERHEAPVVQFTMMLDAGYAADSLARPGTAKFALAMLTEGTARRSSLEIADRAESLGAGIGVSSDLDRSYVSLNALANKLPESLELFSDVVTNPSFPESELERLRARLLAAIQQEKVAPRGIAMRLLPGLIYGEGHAYGNPFSGNGDEVDVKAQTPATLREFYTKFVRPDNATLLVVGDVTLDGLHPLLERTFGAWPAPASAVPIKARDAVAPRAKPRVFLVNRTGAEQSTIVAGYVSAPRSDPDYAALTTVNTVLGGNFVSRLNMNLREDKHWAYGFGSGLGEAEGQGPFFVSGSVETDRTADSMKEVLRELREIATTRLPTVEEIRFAKDSLTLALPGSNETVGEVAGSYANVLAFGLRDSYWNDFIDEVNALTPAALNAAASKLVRPDALTWVIVGDLSKIEEGVRALEIGDVTVLDADGNKLR
jgi:zinc protease